MYLLEALLHGEGLPSHLEGTPSQHEAVALHVYHCLPQRLLQRLT